MKHDLKLDLKYFCDVLNGTKNFELRLNDRNYQVGDTLTLHEVFSRYEDIMYTGRTTNKSVIYVLQGPILGLKEGWVIMGLSTPK